MTTTSQTLNSDELRNGSSGGSNGEPPDGELLARFIEHQEKDAFEALVLRHKSMVMGVCRRVLRDEHAAEDAFQATFMVLLRKSKSIGRPELLANWLYGVAFRVARKARIKAGRERASETCAEIEAPHEPQADPEWIEVKSTLDEELSQLPAKHRLPLVLCYLNGKTNIEAARLLGCPAGSIANRLSMARAELRRRLERRGMVLPAALVALLFKEGPASAAVPEGLIESALAAIGSGLKGGDAKDAGQSPDQTESQPPISPRGASETLEEPVVAPASTGRQPGRWRRRLSKYSAVCLWLFMFSWILFPINDLAGAWGRSGALRTRVGRQAGDPAASNSRIGALLPAWLWGGDSTVSLSSAGDRDAEDERCKRCLGTDCGTDDSDNSASQTTTFWTIFFGQ